MVIGEMLREGGGLMFTWVREPLVKPDCMQMGPEAKPSVLCRVTASFTALPHPNSYVMYPIQIIEWAVKQMKYQSCLVA